MNSNVLHHYDDNHLPVSAKEIVPMIMDIIDPKSVVDVGCGLGQWLKVFTLYGVKTILGIDGEHVPLERIYIEKKFFEHHNLEVANKINTNFKYDLVTSLEVAEHISEINSDNYVELLTSLGSRILFSAAIPFQTGENHINEQPHTYWQEKFIKREFYMLDILRPKIWNNLNVNWWYRQNMFLLVKKDDPLFDEKFVYNGNQLIHPEMLKMYVNLNYELNSSMQSKIKSLFSKLTSLISRK